LRGEDRADACVFVDHLMDKAMQRVSDSFREAEEALEAGDEARVETASAALTYALESLRLLLEIDEKLKCG